MSTPFDVRLLRRGLLPWQDAAAASETDFAAFLSHYDFDVPEGVEHRIGRVSTDAGHVAVHLLCPPRPRGSLVAVHGLFDHAALWRHQVRWALGRDLVVCLFDLPGHGLSAGERAHIEDFAHYVDALEAVLADVGDELPAPRIGLGQSTGCSVLMQMVLDPSRPDPGLDDLVMLAPLVRPFGDRLTRPLIPLLAPLLTRLPRQFRRNTSDSAFNRFLREADPLQARHLPVTWIRAMRRWSAGFEALPPSGLSACIVQGTRDSTVDWRRNLPLIRQRFRSTREVLLEDARHNLMNESEVHRRVIEQVLDERLDALLGESLRPLG